jgi:hypothetical protein
MPDDYTARFLTGQTVSFYTTEGQQNAGTIIYVDYSHTRPVYTIIGKDDNLSYAVPEENISNISDTVGTFDA